MKVKLLITILFIAVSAFGFSYIPTILNTASASFPVETDIVIAEGMTHHDIAELLKEKKVIRSTLYFEFILSEFFADKFAHAGTYKFETPLTTKEVAQIIIDGVHSSPDTKVTFPEGFSVKNIRDFVPATMSVPDDNEIQKLEGHLFPDTYFVSKNMTFEDIKARMQKTMDEKLSSISNLVLKSGLTQDEVIILASLVEREAKELESKKMVAGVLRNRLALRMPLQVDAVFTYILNKTSTELSKEDLLLDSPYNTYTHVGLPPAPISNPGMDSILAVLEPTQTDSLYYLTAPDGTFYYAKTFEEHKKNKERYLR